MSTISGGAAAARPPLKAGALHELLGVLEAGGERDERIRKILKLGANHFGLAAGALTRVRGDTLRIEHATHVGSEAPKVQVSAGDVLRISQTFCDLVVRADGPIIVENASRTELRRHPGHRRLAQNAYVGARVMTAAETFGTVCFFDAHPSPRSYSETDIDLLRLLAWALGTEVARGDVSRASRRLRPLRFDPVTEMLSRAGVEDAVRRLATRRIREGAPCTAIVIELDNLEALESSHGAAACDGLLVAFADLLRSVMRPTDLIARLETDLLLVVMSEADATDALVAASRVSAELDRLRVMITGGALTGTACLAVVPMGPDTGTIDTVLRVAGPPLERARRPGRSAVTLAEP